MSARPTTGRVYLVGAGPGDPELLTLRAVRLLQQTDVIVYDHLVSSAVLDFVSPSAERIYAGKRRNEHTMRQEQINALLIKLAQQGKQVVRLKGGDPFVFGRGGEEAFFLLRRGIQVEVVPGVTAALGCAAAALIPLTHRGLARSVRFLTGHCRADEPLELDWDGLADPETTLVIYMGLAQIGEIAGRLIAHGLAPGTPVAAITDGCDRRQSVVRTTLAHAAEASSSARPGGPTLFVIGWVVDAVGHDPALAAEMPPGLRLYAPAAGHG